MKENRAMTKVEVLRRWQGSPVNKGEFCGVPDDLADELAALKDRDGRPDPAVRIVQRNVPETAGLGGDNSLSGVDHVAHALACIQELELENAQLRGQLREL